MWERTAVCRIESGPEVNSCSSRTEISYSLCDNQHRDIGDQAVTAGTGTKGSRLTEMNECWVNVRELHTGFVQQISVALLVSTRSDVIGYEDESHTESLRRPSCIKASLAALCIRCRGNNRF